MGDPYWTGLAIGTCLGFCWGTNFVLWLKRRAEARRWPYRGSDDGGAW